MKKLSYLCTLGTLFVVLGCNKDSNTGAGGTADMTTRSSDSTSVNPAARDTATSPDNSGKNVRDRNDSNLTPGDQGENLQDLQVTRRIRRAITSNDQLSQEAKNVKIMTTNGKVTLRGPVNSDQERKTIESIVQKEGVPVDDQLEVKGVNQ